MFYCTVCHSKARPVPFKNPLNFSNTSYGLLATTTTTTAEPVFFKRIMSSILKKVARSGRARRALLPPPLNNTKDGPFSLLKELAALVAKQRKAE
jgi:hypothetical protein